MGLFSWNCKVCGHPMLHGMGATNDINGWMNDVVVLQKSGKILKGAYDGYGRINAVTVDMNWRDSKLIDGPECYHKACYKAVGSPVKYTGSSRNAKDQGHFFNEGDHDLAKKGIPGVVNKIKRPLKTWKIKKRAA